MPRSRANLQVIEPLAAVPAPSRARRRAAPERTTAGATRRIVESITTAIVERRLTPGTKLAEQKIADIFQVSRTLVRQALNQLSRDRLVTLEPARGAFVAMPSVEEARQVFEVRSMIEAALVRQLAARISDAQIA
jgi:Transcriptional regulators